MLDMTKYVLSVDNSWPRRILRFAKSFTLWTEENHTIYHFQTFFTASNPWFSVSMWSFFWTNTPASVILKTDAFKMGFQTNTNRAELKTKSQPWFSTNGSYESMQKCRHFCSSNSLNLCSILWVTSQSLSYNFYKHFTGCLLGKNLTLLVHTVSHCK